MARYISPNDLVLDPLAGIGRIHLMPGTTVAGELEFEWAAFRGGRNVVANARFMPYRDKTFTVICTSPVYGNRTSDHHNARDKSKRITYKHFIGRDLHPDNAGQVHWGPEYRWLHEMIWDECYRVLKPGGRFILNVSDHYKDNGQRQYVSMWHDNYLKAIGFKRIAKHKVKTKRMKFGANRKRFPHEYVMVYEKAA